MSERGILMSAPMVRAILAGRKTVTRRVLTVPWQGRQRALPYEPYWVDSDGVLVVSDDYGHYRPAIDVCACPYGQPGDRLWVRETWQAIHVSVGAEGIADDFWAAKTIPLSAGDDYWSVVYAATDPESEYHRTDRGFGWRPSIHMPRWASRLLLPVVDVRVERLQAIAEEDAIAEGVASVAEYTVLWDSINGERPGCSWDMNPWIWRVEFTREEAPVADPTRSALLRWAADFDRERLAQLAAAERGDPLAAWNAEACERQAERLRRDAEEQPPQPPTTGPGPGEERG